MVGTLMEVEGKGYVFRYRSPGLRRVTRRKMEQRRARRSSVRTPAHLRSQMWNVFKFTPLSRDTWACVFWQLAASCGLFIISSSLTFDFFMLAPKTGRAHFLPASFLGQTSLTVYKQFATDIFIPNPLKNVVQYF